MYNVSLKVWNTYYLKNIDMFTFVECGTEKFFYALQPHMEKRKKCKKKLHMNFI
jgi:hypothetical protein